jgi:hypothetical protein
MEKLRIEDFQEETEIVLTDDEILKGFEGTIVNLKEKVERPPVLLSIGLDDKSYGGVHYPLKFATRGNFSVIKGAQKARKSFVKSLVEACVIGGNSYKFTDYLEIKSHDLNNQWVISIDCEQSKYDTWSNGIRIPKIVGHYPENYKVLFWREKSIAERLAYLDWLFMRSPYKDDLGMVVLDGYVDFVYDPNDQKECSIFWNLIMKYSSIANCHITGMLHTNPMSDKMRGHLGTIGSQKAETVMYVENKGEFSLASCSEVRGSKPFKDFTIRIDDQWLPYVSLGDELDDKEFDFKNSK